MGKARWYWAKIKGQRNLQRPTPNAQRSTSDAALTRRNGTKARDESDWLEAACSMENEHIRSNVQSPDPFIIAPARRTAGYNTSAKAGRRRRKAA